MHKKLNILIITLSVFIIFNNRLSAQNEKETLKRVVTEILIATIDYSTWIQSTFQVSFDQNHIVFAERYGNEQGRIVTDGQAGKIYQGMSGEPVFSPDSKRIAFIAFQNGSWFVVTDDIEGQGRYPNGISSARPLLFSPDSKHIAFVAISKNKTLDGNINKTFVVLDNQEGKEYDLIWYKTLVFSPDSKRFAYVATDNNQMVIVLDGKEYKKYESNCCGSFTFSPDSKHFAFIAEINRKKTIITDSAVGKLYDGIIYRPLFSSDGIRYAYGVNENNQSFVIVNDKEESRYDGLLNYKYPLAFSPDSKHITYVANTGNKWFVILDGIKGPEFDGVSVPSFSPDSKHSAYIAKEGNIFFLVLDGFKKEQNQNMDDKVVFSPDSKHIAYASESGIKQFVRIDGKEGKKYSAISASSIIFSPDSKHLVYTAISDNGKMFVVVNDNEGKMYDAIAPIGGGKTTAGGKVIFDTVDSFHYLAMDKNRVYYVQETIKRSQ